MSISTPTPKYFPKGRLQTCHCTTSLDVLSVTYGQTNTEWKRSMRFLPGKVLPETKFAFYSSIGYKTIIISIMEWGFDKWGYWERSFAVMSSVILMFQLVF